MLRKNGGGKGFFKPKCGYSPPLLLTASLPRRTAMDISLYSLAF